MADQATEEPKPRGPILPGHPEAESLGFHSGLFDGYLFIDPDYVYVSAITSLKPGEGNLSALFNTILNAGLGIKVPTPLGRMEEILKHKGFSKTVVFWEEMEENIDLWVLEPTSRQKP